VPPVVESPKPVADPTGGEVISISDPKLIAAFDAELAKPKGPADTRTFPNGFSWRRTFDPTIGQEVFDLFNPAGERCGTRKSESRATKWCEGEGAC
jgi:hypothetical protein